VGNTADSLEVHAVLIFMVKVLSYLSILDEREEYMLLQLYVSCYMCYNVYSTLHYHSTSHTTIRKISQGSFHHILH
jgi:hypothetical protein